MKYRKKPLVIDAIQVTTDTPFEEVAKFVGRDISVTATRITIVTREGAMLVSPNDYIIKGVKGEFYPCKPDIFEASYERVDDIREAMLSKPVLKKKDGDLYLTPKALDELGREPRS